MMKIHEKDFEQSDTLGVSSDAKTSRNRNTKPFNTGINPKRRRTSAVSYEEGDLRGILAEALAKSTDPYRAFLEAGIVKNAAEFLNSRDR